MREIGTNGKCSSCGKVVESSAHVCEFDAPMTPTAKGEGVARVEKMLDRWVVIIGQHRIKGTWKSKMGAEIQASNINMNVAPILQSEYQRGFEEGRRHGK